MTYGLKLEAWILKFKKKSFNNLRFYELQLHFGNSNFFCKALICKIYIDKFKIQMQALSFRDYLKLERVVDRLPLMTYGLKLSLGA